MPFESLLLYLLSLAVVVTACWLALGLVKAFRLHFLSSYLGFLVTINIVGLLNLVVSDLAPTLLRDISPLSLETVYILFGLIGFPLIAVALYFYLTFITGILDEGLSPVFRIAYIVLWIVLFGGLLVRIHFALEQKSFLIGQIMSLVSGAIIFIIPIGALIYLIFRTVRSSRTAGKKGLMTFAVISIVCYFLFFAAFFFLQRGWIFLWAVPFCLLTASILPVLVLRKILSRYGRPILPETFADPGMQRFRANFQLSAREGEILDLLLKGKSNKDIERELFISHHTVRNHIYNIYQKLGVSSRLQLLNLIRTRLESNMLG
jgi:DNA-binding CsgD family transcriptional regulator